MKFKALALCISAAAALPVFEVPGLSLDVTPWSSDAKSQHGTRLHKRVVTISQNSGMSIGGIVGTALGDQVLSILPKANTYSGLIDTLLALVGKANQKFANVENAQMPMVEASIKHHRPNIEETKSPVIRLLEQARDNPNGPWANIGAALGSPIGKEIGKLLETA